MFSKKLKLPVALVLVGMAFNAHAAIETIDFTATTVGYGLAFPNQGSLITGSISFDLNTAFVTSTSTSGSPIVDPINYFNDVQYSFSSPAPFTFTTDGGLAKTQNLTNIAISTFCQNGLCDKHYDFQAYQDFRSFDGGYHATSSDLGLSLRTSFTLSKPLSDFSIPRSLNLSDFSYRAEASYFSSSQANFKYIYNYLDSGPLNTLAFTVSAVPEADTYTMFLAGLGLVGFVARRRRARDPSNPGFRV